MKIDTIKLKIIYKDLMQEYERNYGFIDTDDDIEKWKNDGRLEGIEEFLYRLL